MNGTEHQQVTVVNGSAWTGRTEQLAQLLRTAGDGGVIPDPTGAPLDTTQLATVVVPGFWATEPDALADALGRATESVAGGDASPGRSASGAVNAGAARLTLTVEEAAALLGISRAFAYEAVNRGEIPSIRIGRRILVPRSALDRLVNGPLTEDPSG